MEELRKVLVLVFGLSIAVVTSIAVMMKGWGLQPQSWWWIIGMSLVGHIVAQIVIAVAKGDKQ